MKPCKTRVCENTLTDTTRSEYCQNCRSSFYYWSKKRPAQLVLRRKKLKLYGNRVEIIAGKRGVDLNE